MIILGIETSCDETSASIINDNKLISNVVYTQKIHKKYGGVVPELASQEHLNEIIDVIESTLLESKLKIEDINGIAVTYGPGLMGSLLVGLNYVKARSLSLNIPFLWINHLEGHLFSNYIKNDNILFPHLSLLVSGGHTQLWLVNNYNDFNFLGGTWSPKFLSTISNSDISRPSIVLMNPLSLSNTSLFFRNTSRIYWVPKL